MKKEHVVSVLLAVFVTAAMLLAACIHEAAPPEEEEVTQAMTLRCSDSLPPTINLNEMWEWWGEQVTERTDGRIQFEWYHAGALSKPGEEQEHCRTGFVDMVGTSGMWYDTMQLRQLGAALPFQPSDLESQVRIMWQLYQEFPELPAELENKNMKVILIPPTDTWDIISRVPLKTLDDFKGLKMAILGKQQPKWFEPLGAIPSNLPGPARYEALERGVIDASVMAGMQMHCAFRWHEICKNMIITDLGHFPGWTNAINLDVWNKISPSDQKIMMEVAEELMFEYGPQKVADDGVKYRKLMEEAGVTFYTLSQEDRLKWAQSLPNIAKEWVDEAADDAERELRKRLWLRNLELTKQAGYVWPMDWSNVD